MITVKPAIHRNTLELKQTTSSSTHTTGDFYMHNEHHAVHGLFQSCSLVYTDLHGEHGISYEGHVRVTIDAVRRIDGTELNLGIARFKIDSSNQELLTTNLLESNASWDSWVNGSRGSEGLHDYLDVNLHSSYQVKFFKGDFTDNESDTDNNNVLFKNEYALDYTIKIEFLHRRPASLNQTNIINSVPSLDRQNNNTNLNLRPEVNSDQGTVQSDVNTYFGLGCNKPGGIFIQKDNGFDYLFYGVYSNETESAGSSRILPYSSTLSDADPYDRHNSISDWFRVTRDLHFPNTLQTGMPMGNCHVDIADPFNGGNPVLYHQTEFRTNNSALARQIGYTALSDAPSEESYFSSLATDDIKRTRAKLPLMEDQGTCRVALAGVPVTAPYIIVNVLSNARSFDRPAIYIRSNGVGILVNNGPYETPQYNRMLAFSTNTSLSDTSSIKYSHNNVNVPSFAKGLTLVNLIDGEDGWYYFGFAKSSGFTRGVLRMKYTGLNTPSSMWGWLNWDFEQVFEYTPSSTNTVDSASTQTSSVLTNLGIGAALSGNVVYGTSNGYPIFWGFIGNKFCKWYHNGGTSATSSQNWNMDILAGSTSTTSTFPTAGVAMSADFTPDTASSSWYYRKQVVDGWLYFQNNTKNYIGRICIDDTNPDYLKFEPLNINSTAASNTTSTRF